MISVIIAAAGKGRRMALEKNKVLTELAGKPMLQYSLELFNACPGIGEIIVVASAEDVDDVSAIANNCNCKIKTVIGGAERQQSIANALAALDVRSEYVMVHDGARPLLQAAQLDSLIAKLCGDSAALILAVPVKDTIKTVEAGLVCSTPERSKLWAVQTPQAFDTKTLVNAYKYATAQGYLGTDDASLVEYTGLKVSVVESSYENIKITTPEDMEVAEGILRRRDMRFNSAAVPRVGMGYDVHKLVEGRKLWLGGVDVPHGCGLLGHSDADVLLHAVMDALLGAAGEGDIGRHFPDTDEKYRGACSMDLLRHVVTVISAHGYGINNIDATIVAQSPKLAHFIPEMVRNIAAACAISEKCVNVKATTTEELGFAGRKEGIASYAIASII